ncbi:hypothetical protein [Acidovorax temperans]|uniref:hypothetical protein n=1 Tax=Acidovorax temperans TaxID=80878 RepID=UPI000A446892|nr:hypothetical protein [Acidovorax temperans]
MTHLPPPTVPAHWPSEDALIAGLKVTPPGGRAQPARTFGLAWDNTANKPSRGLPF